MSDFPYRSNVRDRFVAAVCNFLFRRVATREYYQFVTVLISLGRKSLGTKFEEEK